MAKKARRKSGSKGGPSKSLEIIRELDQLLERFNGQTSVTIANGTTCAFLGDERTLREFIVADEAVRALGRAGHVAYNFLFDDSMDPLSDRQLRIAVDKDEKMCQNLAEFCGKPIAHIPDPWGCHESYAEHFEEMLLSRLSRIGCRPTLVSTARLYGAGVYRRIIEMVLDRNKEIDAFLKEKFPTYSLGALFYPICPKCGRIQATRLTSIGESVVRVACTSCNKTFEVGRPELRGKLSWKLDCAARWTMFAIDAEVFNKAYLEPTTGTFVVAQALSREFFEGSEVTPILYGMVHMEREVSGKILDCLTTEGLRGLFGSKWANDIHLTHDRIVLEASRAKVRGDMSLLDFTKQLMPVWEFKSRQLTWEERALLSSAQSFAFNYLEGGKGLRFPTPESIEKVGQKHATMVATVVDLALTLRRNAGGNYEVFDGQMKTGIDRLGSVKKDVSRHIRELTGLTKGLPLRRLLFSLPEEYMNLLVFILRAYAASPAKSTKSSAA